MSEICLAQRVMFALEQTASTQVSSLHECRCELEVQPQEVESSD